MSDSPNLVAGMPVTNAIMNAYRFDRITGENLLASVSTDGVSSANGAVYNVILSRDGNTVSFTSTATNLHPLDRDVEPGVFAHDFLTGTTHLISVNATGDGSANGSAGNLSMSADGNLLVFATTATNLSEMDKNEFSDLYVRDIAASSTRLAAPCASSWCWKRRQWTNRSYQCKRPDDCLYKCG